MNTCATCTHWRHAEGDNYWPHLRPLGTDDAKRSEHTDPRRVATAPKGGHQVREQHRR